MVVLLSSLVLQKLLLFAEVLFLDRGLPIQNVKENIKETLVFYVVSATKIY